MAVQGNWNAGLLVSFPDAIAAENAVKAFLPETNLAHEKRSVVSMGAHQNTVRLHIRALDEKAFESSQQQALAALALILKTMVFAKKE